MLYYGIKLALSALIIVLVSELAKRQPTWGGLLASLPLVSLLAMVWLYVDTRDVGKVSELSLSIFWLVLPSLAFFLVLPLLLRQGLGFAVSLAHAALVTIAAYALMLMGLKRFGISFT
jgi:thiol:disulfide interchange protein